MKTGRCPGILIHVMFLAVTSISPSANYPNVYARAFSKAFYGRNDFSNK